MNQKRLALITGGTSGIGFGIAKALAPSCDLALGYEKNSERATRAIQELSALAPDTRAVSFQCPLSGQASAQILMDQVKETFGRTPEILVHCAGQLYDALFLGSDFARHLELVQTHLISAMALSQLALKPMYQAGFGRIVLISSISARYAKRGQTSYAASKAGLEAFARTLALEVAHRGITVNTVAPGLIDTDFAADLISKVKSDSRELRKLAPAGFIGTPDDVASLVAYLCSDKARYINGTVITVDGARSTGDTHS